LGSGKEAATGNIIGKQGFVEFFFLGKRKNQLRFIFKYIFSFNSAVDGLN